MTLTLSLRPGAQDRLTGHVDPQLGRVEHLDSEDVVLSAIAGAERLGHRRDADTEETTLLTGLLLILQELLVADRFEADIETLPVLT
jgi:hypothetical protein